MKNTLARLSTYKVLICLGIVSGVAELAYGILNQSAIPPYVQELGLTAHIGIIFAAFLLVETVFKSPMGSLGDRLGRRPLIVGGALLSAFTAFGMTVVKKLWGLLALRAFDGLAAAAIWPTMVAAMGGSVGPQRRTTAMSVLTVTYIGGLAVGPLLGGIANDVTDSRLTSFYIVSILFLLTAAIACFLTPHRSREETETAREAGERPFRLSDIALGLKAIPDMMVLAFTAFFAIGLLIPIVKLFAMNELGMSETGYGGLVFPIALAVAGASLLSGRIGDRWGKARSVRTGLLISAAAMWTITVVRGVWELATAGMFLGIGFVLAMPAWLALVSDMASPWTRGAVIGALGTAQGVGAILGASAGSYLYKLVRIDLWGIEFATANSHYSPFVVSAGALTTCFGLSLLFVKEGDRRRIGMAGEGEAIASKGESERCKAR
ncbi:MAG TPA: MFS transporter [Armatimonadota bacterium]|nr:MFS transporter [Armatimonadota bacterium]